MNFNFKPDSESPAAPPYSDQAVIKNNDQFEKRVPNGLDIIVISNSLQWFMFFEMSRSEINKLFGLP